MNGRGFKILTIVGCLGTLVFLGLEAWNEHFAGEWRAWQDRYAEGLPADLRAGFAPALQQAFLPDLERVDRCQSCHVGIDDPAMAGAELPLAAHPGDLLSSHPVEDFGCTVCHDGQGRAVSLPAAHGRVPHWEEPMLAGDLVYTSCGRCHAANALFGPERELYGEEEGGAAILADDLAATLPGAALLARGKELAATSGCLGCHTYQGLGGTLGPDLTHVGDKGVHGYDFSHLPAGTERTPLAWLIAHFEDPSAVSPGSVMPGFGVGEEDARALAAYMLSLRSIDVPARFRVPPARRSTAPAGGEALYGLFCVACHGRDLQSGAVTAFRTPSIGNESLLCVADDAYLASIVRNGRRGTNMPAWREDAGGLTSAQIDALVATIRAHAPDRADASAVSAAAGDPRAGAALYRGRCATCHGLAGEGGIGTRLNSPDVLAVLSDDALARTIVEGRPNTGMPSWRNLRTSEVSDLVAFLRSWEGPRVEIAAVAGRLAAGEGDADLGARIYAGRCAACHGPGGEGAIGPSLANDGFLSLVSDEYLAYAIRDGRPGTAMPAWRSLAAEDVGDLVTHLRTLSDAPRRALPASIAQGDPEHGELLFARACAACHGPEATGGSGPQLRNPVFLDHATDGYLFTTIAEGRPGTPMRGFARAGAARPDRPGGAAGIADLTSAQIADVVAWLRWLRHAPPPPESARTVLGSIGRGQEIYENLGACARCHGARGEGGIGPALGQPSFQRQTSEGHLIATMVLGREGTPMRQYASGGLADLSAPEIMDVSAYVRSLAYDLPAGPEGWRVYAETEDRIRLGRELFAGYCASCHGSDGRGGFAPELANPDFLAAASDGFLAATIARGRDGTPMRAFGPGPAGLAILSPDEVRAIVAAIRAWAGEPPPATSPPPTPPLPPSQ
ncbi:MAG: c-type cytochrome [Planctomycetota bacterium]